MKHCIYVLCFLALLCSVSVFIFNGSYVGHSAMATDIEWIRRALRCHQTQCRRPPIIQQLRFFRFLFLKKKRQNITFRNEIYLVALIPQYKGHKINNFVIEFLFDFFNCYSNSFFLNSQRNYVHRWKFKTIQNDAQLQLCLRCSLNLIWRRYCSCMSVYRDCAIAGTWTSAM